VFKFDKNVQMSDIPNSIDDTVQKVQTSFLFDIVIKQKPF